MMHPICDRYQAEPVIRHGEDCPHLCTCGGTLVFHESPVHNWFELSYAQYATIPRSIMEAMPHEWQERMVRCLEELDEAFDWRPKEGRYWCHLKDGKGRYVEDPLQQYRRPDYAYIETLRQEKPQ